MEGALLCSLARGTGEIPCCLAVAANFARCAAAERGESTGVERVADTACMRLLDLPSEVDARLGSRLRPRGLGLQAKPAGPGLRVEPAGLVFVAAVKPLRRVLPGLPWPPVGVTTSFSARGTSTLKGSLVAATGAPPSSASPTATSPLRASTDVAISIEDKGAGAGTSAGAGVDTGTSEGAGVDADTGEDLGTGASVM